MGIASNSLGLLAPRHRPGRHPHCALTRLPGSACQDARPDVSLVQLTRSTGNPGVRSSVPGSIWRCLDRPAAINSYLLHERRGHEGTDPPPDLAFTLGSNDRSDRIRVVGAARTLVGCGRGCWNSRRSRAATSTWAVSVMVRPRAHSRGWSATSLSSSFTWTRSTSARAWTCGRSPSGRPSSRRPGPASPPCRPRADRRAWPRSCAPSGCSQWPTNR